MLENNENLGFVEIADDELEEVSGGKKSSSSRYIEGASGKSNVRTGPGLDYRSIGVLHVGERAPYLGSSATDDRGVKWYKISWDGTKAWVSSRYTKKR